MYLLGILGSSLQSSLGSIVLFLGFATLEQNSLQWLPSTPKAPLGLNFFITLLFLCFGAEHVLLCILEITGQLAVFGSVLLPRGPQRLNSNQ